MEKPNVDRARSRLQQMTMAKLLVMAGRHGVAATSGGRRLTRKQLVAKLMLVDEVVEELGWKE